MPRALLPLTLALAACVTTLPAAPSASTTTTSALRQRASLEARGVVEARAWGATLDRWTDSEGGPPLDAIDPLPPQTGGAAEVLALLTFIDARRCDRERAIERIDRAQERIDRARSAARDAEVGFEPGRDELGPAARAALRDFAVIARSLPAARFHVAGHTSHDAVGDRRSSWLLSEARARRVVEFLVGEGVDRPRMSFAGYADTEPRGGDARDRRVELRLLPPEVDE